MERSPPSRSAKSRRCCSPAPATRWGATWSQGGRAAHPRALIAAREPGAVRPETWTARAVPEGDGFILQGSKALAAMPRPEDFLIVFANAPAGPTAFLLDAPGSRAQGFAAHWTGPKVSANGEVVLSLDACRADNVLGEAGKALALGAAEAPRAWIRMGARYVGLVERLGEMAAEHARDWVALGAPLAGRPAVQRLLAELRVEVESARWLVYHAAWLADRGEPIRGPAAQVRLFTGEMLQRAVDRVTMIYAGPGPSPQIDLRRMVRGVAPAEALEWALEHARLAIAADVLGPGSKV